jgi:hypothetical protein
MRLIGLMVVRNESWVLEASMKAALQWVDGLAIYLDRCTDNTVEIVKKIAKGCKKDILVNESDPDAYWQEMDHRHKNLQDGRGMGGTHFAIIDADEILTSNLLPWVRGWCEELMPGQVLDLPMVAPWGNLDFYSPNTRSVMTVAFMDKSDLGWAPRGEEKYHHHNRPPHGFTGRMSPLSLEEGGCFHLQWASIQRKIWKDRHYMMTELLRWNYPEDAINEKYHWWDKLPHGADLKAVPPGWWAGYDKSSIRPTQPSWYEWEVKKLIREHGRERFSKLSLFGL